MNRYVVQIDVQNTITVDGVRARVEFPTGHLIIADAFTEDAESVVLQAAKWHCYHIEKPSK